jgi:hypothetical protein
MADTESLSDKLEPELNAGDFKRTNSRVGTDLTQSQVESLKKQAELVRGTEQNIVAAANAQDRYNGALAQLIREKNEQVDRLELTIETMIETIQGRAAGITNFEDRQRQVQQIERLEERLETVREIRDDSGLFNSKIEELAEEKLRQREPALTKERDASLKTERLKMAQELFAAKELNLEQELGRSIDR